MRKLAKQIGLISSMLMLLACTQTMNLTSSGRYYQALKVFDDNVATYLSAYRAASPETQAKWKQNVDPVVLAANQALEAWRVSIGTSSEVDKEKLYNGVFQNLLSALFQIGVLKKGG